MTDGYVTINALLNDGYCCATALAAIGLREKGSANPELLDAMRSLCGGLGSGLLCGALSGAACMMNLLDPASKDNGAVGELASWFADVYGTRYGGINCRDITGGKLPSAAVCRNLIAEVYAKAKEILTENGYIFNE
ncbi:MAG: C-GCAxxG-C-C family protein [Clostridiales bacterium]|jgi:hypothetical protein|nr:C-GCAxxG-C-C family protein [Clostridiales bacterium]